MMQLESHCPDCGRQVRAGSLCSACEQDREMQLASVERGEMVRAIRGEA
ncbi:MAG: hypothetical protein ABR508_05345 [Candidatus Baltobacteraceae bacterium]